jgi:S1-C subfamily serine protease
MRNSRFLKPEALIILLAAIGIAIGTMATVGRGVALDSLFSPVNKSYENDYLTSVEEAWRIQDEKNTISTYQSAKFGVVLVSTSSGSGATLSRGNGSGFFIDNEGHIVTNHHVIENADRIEIHTHSGNVYEATVVGADRLTDLAVLKVMAPQSDIHPLPIGDYSAVRVGQKAIVLGSPLATGSSLGLDRSPTITTGVISAIDRSLPIESQTKPGVNDFTVENLIQTDAAVNPGNSGGPLLNSRGEVVGVVTAIIGSANGIGFAIPSSVMAEVIPEILKHGEVSRAFMGISYLPLDTLRKNMTEEEFRKMGLSVEEGALITDVDSQGPAHKAGLKPAQDTVMIGGVQYVTGGDVITAIDHVPVKGSDLSSKVLEYRPGDIVTLTVIRNGKTLEIDITLGSR